MDVAMELPLLNAGGTPPAAPPKKLKLKSFATLRLVWKYAKPERKFFLPAIFFLCSAAVANLLIPTFITNMMDAAETTKTTFNCVPKPLTPSPFHKDDTLKPTPVPTRTDGSTTGRTGSTPAPTTTWRHEPTPAPTPGPTRRFLLSTPEPYHQRVATNLQLDIVHRVTPAPFWRTAEGKEEKQQRADYLRNQGNISRLLVYCLVATGIEGVSLFLYTALFRIAGAKLVKRTRSSVFRSFLQREILFHDENSANELVSYITEVEELDELLWNYGEMFQEALMVVGGLMFFFVINLELGGTVLGFVVVMCLIAAPYSKFIAKKTLELIDTEAESCDYAQNVLANIRDVKRLRREEAEFAAHDQYSLAIYKVDRALSFASGFFEALISMLTNGGLCVGMWLAAFLVISPDHPLTASKLTAFFMYADIVYTFLESLFEKLEEFKVETVTAKMLFDFIETAAEADEEEETDERARPLTEDLKVRKVIDSTIEFCDVSFQHPIFKKESLRNLGFTCRASEMVLLLGPSAANLHLVSDMIESFYKPTKGRVLLGGRPINEYSKSAIIDSFSFLRADDMLVSGTVFANVAMASPGCDESQVYRACERAGFDKFVSEFEEGYMYVIDPLECRLSKLEKKLLFMARVFLKDPHMLFINAAGIFNLHDEGAEIVFPVLKELMEHRSVILLMNSIMPHVMPWADHIFVFDTEGVNVESGTHDELLALKKTYFSLLEQKNKTAALNLRPAARGRLSHS